MDKTCTMAGLETGRAGSDHHKRFGRVWNELIVKIAGEPWKLSDHVIEEWREDKMPSLLR
jgi:hypothetical protein